MNGPILLFSQKLLHQRDFFANQIDFLVYSQTNIHKALNDVYINIWLKKV